MSITKPAHRVAYVILDAEGNWHKSELGALLAYETKDNALEGFKTHGGARIIKYRFLFDGEIEEVDITP